MIDSIKQLKYIRAPRKLRHTLHRVSITNYIIFKHNVQNKEINHVHIFTNRYCYPTKLLSKINVKWRT